jgi:transcriptional regulator with XRE-family HTH domain
MSYKIITTVSKVVETITEVEVTLVGYVGSRIKMYREELGLKQIDVSRKTIQPDGSCAISAGSVSYLESGVGNPGINNLEEIARVLGVHISDLFPVKEVVVENLENIN